MPVPFATDCPGIHAPQRDEAGSGCGYPYHLQCPQPPGIGAAVCVDGREIQEKASRLVTLMETNIPEGLTVFAFPAAHRPKLRTTNVMEMLKREIRRCTKVVSIFPTKSPACANTLHRASGERRRTFKKPPLLFPHLRLFWHKARFALTQPHLQHLYTFLTENISN